MTSLMWISFNLIHPPMSSRQPLTNILLQIGKSAKTVPLNCRPISLLPIFSKVMESIIAVDMKSFLFPNNLISDHQFRFTPSTLPWTCCFYSPKNGWRPSMSEMKSGLPFWTYIVLMIKSGILPYYSNSTYGIQGQLHTWLTSSTLRGNMWL